MMPLENVATPKIPAVLEPGDLVDEREAAAILAAEVRTLRNWRALGKGPRYHKIGQRMVRYLRADLTTFIAGADESEAA
jgi:hypothetical protein